MEVSTIESKLVKDALEKEDNVDIFDNPSDENRSLLLYGNTPKIFTPSKTPREETSASAPDRAIYSRQAFLEVPVSISSEVGVKVAPNARLSTSSTFPLADNKKWSGSVKASAVIRGYTGYTQQNVSIKYKPNRKASVKTGVVIVRNRQRIYAEGTTKVGTSNTLSARYSQLASITTIRGAQLSLSSNRNHSLGILSTSCQIPLTNHLLSSKEQTTLSVAASSKTIHPWRISLDWNPLHKLSWQVSTAPQLSPYQKMRLSLGQKRGRLWTLSANIVRKIKEKSYLGLAVSYNASQGALWIISWNHGDLSFNVPISFLGYYDAWAALCLTGLTKIIQDGLAYIFQLDQLAEQATEMERQQALQTLEAARGEAMDQQELMKRQARSRMNAEADRKGLIIHDAKYVWSDGSSHEVSLDVTIPLQFWVNNGSLELPAGSKKNLLGFFDITSNQETTKQTKDFNAAQVHSVTTMEWWTGFFCLPAPSARTKAGMPILRVLYEFQGRKNDVVVQDDEKLVLPRN